MATYRMRNEFSTRNPSAVRCRDLLEDKGVPWVVKDFADRMREQNCTDPGGVLLSDQTLFLLLARRRDLLEGKVVCTQRRYLHGYHGPHHRGVQS